ncbi:MAG: aminotransferase class III-fold pyridoxal phosphate-dependent enzyme [Desulfurococcus sp.]|uniref:aminotransferase class III-fold pyridoxal phosphate-dependent enzyme n=2 Tax=Desulfurococcus sp. TaxID=51678 RepID=UPI003165D0EB
MSLDTFIEEYHRVFSRSSRTEYVPAVIKEAYNSVVIDVYGRKYIDFSSSASVVNTGYNNPKILGAVEKQLRRLIHYTHIYGFNEPALKLARKLISITGVVDGKVILGLSGSDANEGALFLSKAYNRRTYLLSYVNSFHGCTLMAAKASGIDLSRRVVRLLGEEGKTIFLPYPDCYRCPLGYTWSSCRLRCVEIVKEKIEELNGDVYGLIIEPIQGDGGIIPAPEEYIRELQRILDKWSIPLIVDEVQTGVGRTGRWLAIQYYGVNPDIVTLGKALGGGLPISAIIGRSDIMESLPDFSYSFTLSGNPVASAAALAVIEYIEENNLLERARILGEHVVNELKGLMKEHELIGDVRGKGLMIGVDLVKDRETRERAVTEAKKVVWRAFELGLIVFSISGNILRIQPPLTIEEEILDEGLRILEKAINDVEKGRVSDNVVKMVKGWGDH